MAIICTAALLAWPTSGQASGVATGDSAPAFTLPDTDGTKHSLSDFRGQVVVLEWTNFGCPFVKKHYSEAHMQALQKRFAAMDQVVWLSICSSAPGRQGHMSASQATEELQQKGFAGTAYLLDEDGTVGQAYGARRTPHMFVIDPDGKVAYQGAIDSIASADPDDVEKAEPYVVNALEALLAGRQPAVDTTKPYGCSIKY